MEDEQPIYEPHPEDLVQIRLPGQAWQALDEAATDFVNERDRGVMTMGDDEEILKAAQKLRNAAIEFALETMRLATPAE